MVQTLATLKKFLNPRGVFCQKMQFAVGSYQLKTK